MCKNNCKCIKNNSCLRYKDENKNESKNEKKTAK